MSIISRMIDAVSTPSRRKMRAVTDIEREYASSVINELNGGGTSSREIAIASASQTDILALSATSAPMYLTTSATGTPKSSSILDVLLARLIPKTKKDARILARDWYSTDDLFGGLIDVKAGFIASGFRLSVSRLGSSVVREAFARAKELANNGDVSTNNNLVLNTVKAMANKEKESLDVADVNDDLLFEFELEHRIAGVVKTLAKDYCVHQSMILYWRVSPPAANVKIDGVSSDKSGITDIAAICPADADWTNSLGRDLLRVELPKELVDRINKALNEYNRALRIKLIESMVNEEGIPIEYVLAISRGETAIILDKEAGHRWIVVTEERKGLGLAAPIVSTKMALPMATRKLLTEGDYSASVMMKNFITHITSGETAPTSSANPRATWTNKTKTDALLALFTGPSKAPVISTDHTVSVKYVYPPLEFFSPDKYACVNAKIFDFTGVSVSVYSGTGSKYSGGFLSIKRMSSSISGIRSIIRFCVEAMFFSDEVRSNVKIPEGHYIKSTFGEQGLKEAKQLFDEVKFLVERHFLGPDQAGELLGHDPGSLRTGVEMATIDDAATGVWGGNYAIRNVDSQSRNTSDNDSSDNPGGRPPNADTTVDESTRTQDPAP